MLNVAILLAGGLGKRMQSETPKQFMPLGKKPVAFYSFETLLSIPSIVELVVVVDPTWESLFLDHPQRAKTGCNIHFTKPGKRRQDSVDNGFSALETKGVDFVLIHDSARPFITKDLVNRTFIGALDTKACALALPLSFTVKAATPKGVITKELNRQELFEIQTPQVLSYSLLKKGLQVAKETEQEVTDDLALATLAGATSTLVPGSRRNIKLTCPDDFLIAQSFLGLP